VTRWEAPSGDFRLDGQVAVVTGASRGIGLAIAQAFVGAGAKVVITGRKPEPLAEAAATMGDAARFVAGSVGDDAMAEQTCAAAVEAFGRLDILVNGAGTNPQYGPLIDADLGAFDKVIATNLRAPLVWSQAAWRAGLRDHGGAILNVASVAALLPTSDTGSYAISKAALHQLTRVLAGELGPGVRVNSVAPAIVRTKFSEVLLEDEEAVVATYPVGRVGEPADVAQAALYLCSPAAAWVSGHLLVLDGGGLAMRKTY
jgi:NAD(P)-dependent dehydrogenase (short-subunit alcohol dehydrogenase family)